MLNIHPQLDLRINENNDNIFMFKDLRVNNSTRLFPQRLLIHNQDLKADEIRFKEISLLNLNTKIQNNLTKEQKLESIVK